MSAHTNNILEGLEGFEQLDMGELYYIGSREFVSRGLLYYRNIAVEGLEWDEATKRMTAQVAGSRFDPYEVCLQLRSGHLEHTCDCPAWGKSSGCKHVIAAAAAMFLAVQGRSPGGHDMPPDYAQDLRQQLGYRDVGGAPGDGNRSEPGVETELWLVEARPYGDLEFQILGAVPHEFLRSLGLDFGNLYGFSITREFTIEPDGTGLATFLSKAKAHKIPVVIMVDGETRKLEMRRGACQMREVYDYSQGAVARELNFENAKGDRLEPYCQVPRSSYVILTDGSVRRVDTGRKEKQGDPEPLTGVTEVELFNEFAYMRNYRAMAAEPKFYAFCINGEPSPPEALEADAARIEMDLYAVENAAGEREALEFNLYAHVGGQRIDLHRYQQRLIQAVLGGAYGSVLSAKRRVRGLCDLLRRVLLAHSEGRIADLHELAGDFPELLGETYLSVVRQVVGNVLRVLGNAQADAARLVLDEANERWVACPLPLGKVAMLLFSMFDAATRDDLRGLAGGGQMLSRHDSGDGVLQRLVSICAALGVRVRFNDQAIRTAPLSINLQGSHGGTGKDIDWFELHPSITCGDRTISAAEWKRLIGGQFFLEAADGSLIMPEVGAGEADGLQMIAEVLQRAGPRRGEFGGADADSGLQVTRLEMLDWIALRRRGVRVQLPEAVEAVFERLNAFDGLEDFVPPKSLDAELRPYQSEGCAWINFLYEHRFGACLADDMGLGKTVQTIAFLAHRFEQEPPEAGSLATVLIVVPPSLVFNWLDEFARFAPQLRVADCLSRAQWPVALKEAQVVLTTYDRVRVEVKTMQTHNFDIVVFDEAHNLKNVTTARTKAAGGLRRRFTLCLTGTPVENNVSEFYSVLTAAVPGIFGTLKDFKERYRHDPERTLRRATPFILRRTKDKILKELPKKEEHELFLEMSALQKEIYTRTISEVRAEVALAYEDRPEQQAGIVALAAILRLRQVCVSPALLGKPMPEPAPKFSHMADQLEELQAEGNAALVFSQFIGGLDQMEAVAKARGIPYLRMDGRTPVAQRKDLVQSFQSGDGPAFFFISLKTGGVGLNLTRANYVFHLDPWWNPAVENQASDRAHRIGQTRSVFVQRLIMQHSIEARMLELKARKAELFRQLVEAPGGKSTAAGLSRTDFEYLLNG